MIETLWVTNPAGNTLEVNLRSSDQDHGLLIFDMSGLGSPNATVSGVGGPNFDGVRANFVRADARHILLTVAVSAQGDAEEVARQKIYTFFPVKKEITFRITTGAKDIYIQAFVESVEMSHFAKVENAVISLFCPDPYFIDMIEDYYRIPYDSATNIPYDGELSTGVDLNLTLGGYVNSVTITNDREDQSMTIDLTVIDSSGDPGDKVAINTRYGQKSAMFWDVSAQSWETLIAGIAADQDWIQLYPGDNLITVTSTTITKHADAPGPIRFEACWILDERDGGNALDLHAAKHFTRYNTIGERAGLIHEYARNFIPNNTAYFNNGSSDGDLCPTTNFAIAVWVYPVSFGPGVSDFRTIFSTFEDDDGYELKIDKDGYPWFGIKKGGVPVYHDLNIIPLNTWSLIYVWYDAAADVIYGQIDDETATSQSTVPTPDPYSSVSSIGGVSGGNDKFDGGIQALQFFNNIITLSERTFTYNSGDGRSHAEMVGEIDTLLYFRPLFGGV
jgi:hypothetical protein